MHSNSRTWPHLLSISIDSLYINTRFAQEIKVELGGTLSSDTFLLENLAILGKKMGNLSQKIFFLR